MVQWFIGSSVHLFSVHWFVWSSFIGSLVLWFIGSSIYWSNSSSFHQSIRSSTHQFFGSWVHRSLVHLFIFSSDHPFVHSFICTCAYLSIPSFDHSFVRPFVRVFMRSCVRASCIHSFIRSSIRWFIGAYVHSFICFFVPRAQYHVLNIITWLSGILFVFRSPSIWRFSCYVRRWWNCHVVLYVAGWSWWCGLSSSLRIE